MVNKSIFGFNVKNENPEFFRVLELVYKEQDWKKIVFYDEPSFKWEADLGDTDYELLERNKTSVPPYGSAWDKEIIYKYLPKLTWKSNIIYLIPSLNDGKSLLLKDYNWNLIYHCYDYLRVELFTTDLQIKENIINKFECDICEFPGSMNGPGGFDIDI